jgi:hypothetical protein
MSRKAENARMTRVQVFAELAARGADRALVAFSGGNDEGGADSIALYVGEAEIRELPAWPSRGDSDQEQADDRLVDALSFPV